MKKKFVFSCIVSIILFGILLGVIYKVEVVIVYVVGGVWSYGIGKYYVWFYYSYNKRNYGLIVVGKYLFFSGVVWFGV